MADNLTDAERAKRAMENAFQDHYEAKWPDANFELLEASGALDPDREEFFARYIERQQAQPRQEVTPPARPAETDDEEEKRRAGRGGGEINPANATHSLNIRPDVGEGPAGLEVYTTMKSKDYPANSGAETGGSEPGSSGREERKEPAIEPAPNPETGNRSEPSPPLVDEFAADLAAAEAAAREEDPQRDHSFRQASEESTKRQEAERAAHSGEDVPGQVASSEPDSFAADLRSASEDATLPQDDDAYRRAAEEITKRQEAERAIRSGEEVPADARPAEMDAFAADLRAAKEAAEFERGGDGQDVPIPERPDSGPIIGRSGPGLF